MSDLPNASAFSAISQGYSDNPALSLSLRAEAYTDQAWFAADQRHVIADSWQWVCHIEKLRTPGSYVTAIIAGQPIAGIPFGWCRNHPVESQLR